MPGRSLTVSTRKRAALLPNVPTVAEAGHPDAEYLFWGGVAAPAKTPSTIIHKLHDEIEKALQLPAVREKLATLGVEVQLLTVEQFDKFVNDDMAASSRSPKVLTLSRRTELRHRGRRRWTCNSGPARW
jgi:tripartite-type tricarboxylate transporter receptor subunit TctC